MKLEFTDDFLKRVERVTKFFRLDKEEYLQELYEAIENVDDYEIEQALEGRVFDPDIDFDLACKCIGGAYVTMKGWYVDDDDCTNWDEYWTSRKG